MVDRFYSRTIMYRADEMSEQELPDGSFVSYTDYAQLERDLADIKQALELGKPFGFDPATGFIQADDGGAGDHCVFYVPKVEAERDLAEARAEAGLQSEAREIALARAKELATEHNAAKKRHEDHLVRLSRSLGGLSRYINEQGDYRSLEDWEAFLLERANQLLHREDDERRRAEAAEAERDRLAAELRNDRHELKRLMQAVPGAHFCQDWDGLLVWPGTPEADACTCASLQPWEKGG